MAQSQEEANRTLALAREKADQLTHKDNIVVEAQRRADQIQAKARADAEATRVEADNYVLDSLMKLQNEMDKLSNQVRNGIRTIEDEQMRRASTPSAPQPE
jgi:regulator of protease activity HflC (stomatin/prohibitin superfamily)